MWQLLLTEAQNSPSMLYTGSDASQPVCLDHALINFIDTKAFFSLSRIGIPENFPALI